MEEEMITIPKSIVQELYNEYSELRIWAKEHHQPVVEISYICKILVLEYLFNDYIIKKEDKKITTTDIEELFTTKIPAYYARQLIPRLESMDIEYVENIFKPKESLNIS